MILQRGQEYYCTSLAMRVIFLRYDTAGMAMVQDASGEQYTVNEGDLQKLDWTPGDILEREA